MHYYTPAVTCYRFCILVTMLIFASVCVANAQWTPPIGIPMPPFGIVEVAPAPPSPWNADTPGFYYVKEGGTNPSNGWPGHPRSQIPSVLPAGSVVVVAGVYTVNHEGDLITANGTATQPVYIRGTSSTEAPIITQKWVVEGSYYVIENIKATWANSSQNGKLIVSGHHIAVRHNDFRGDTNGTGGVYPGGSNLLIWNNKVHDVGDVNASFDQDNHCIGVGSETDHLWIVDNELARCSGDGIQINAGSEEKESTLHHVYVGRNIAHGNKQTGFWTKQAVDVIFSQNVCYAHRPSNSSSGGCMGGQYGPVSVWFIFNHIYNSESGIRIEGTSDLGSGTDVFIVGNVIHNITDSSTPDPGNPHASGAIVFRGLVKHYIVNNTLWNYQAGIMSPTGGFLHIEGNILGGRNNPQGRDIYIEDSTSANTSVLSHNILDPASVRIQWGGQTVYQSLASFINATGKGQGSIQADPQFVDVTNRNFQLRAASPAVNTALSDAVYATFLNRYGLDIRKDFLGAVRPQATAFDIGAYEYASQVVLQPPVAPGNLELR